MSEDVASASATPEELRSQPVDLERSREAAQRARETVQEFRAYAEEIPLGRQTRAIFTQLVDHIASTPDSIQVFANNPYGGAGRLIHRNLFDGLDPSADATITPESFIVEIVPDTIDGQFTTEMLELARSLGMQLDDKTARKLAYAHVVGHELAHGIQNAYSAAMPVKEENLMPDAFPTPHYRKLEEDTLLEGISEPIEVPARPILSGRIESERFSEGLAQRFVLYEMQRLGIIEPGSDLQHRVLEMLRQQRQNDHYRDAVRIAADVPAAAEARQLMVQLEAADTTINHIGYGRPHDQDTLDRILALTP